MFSSVFVKAVTEIRDTLYAIWQKISMPFKLSGKMKFSMASCLIISSSWLTPVASILKYPWCKVKNIPSLVSVDSVWRVLVLGSRGREGVQTDAVGAGPRSPNLRQLSHSILVWTSQTSLSELWGSVLQVWSLTQLLLCLAFQSWYSLQLCTEGTNKKPSHYCSKKVEIE